MKALTLHQPWASLVALGVKTIETRSWSTSYRGPLAIHAGAKMPASWTCVGDYRVKGFGRNGLVLLGPGLPEFRSTPKLQGYSVPLGAVVATCTLVRCVPIVRPASETGEIPPDWALIDPGHDHGLRWTEPLTYARHGWKLHHCEDQRPYGDFSPGRYAWLLADIKPAAERCPACMGAAPEAAPGVCVSIDGEWWHEPGSCPYCAGACGSCKAGTVRPKPIPARGRQGLWEWAG